MTSGKHDQKRIQDLLELARQARHRAYAPYSHFAVGAAVLTTGGECFTGCNVENASYGATMCAERVAIFSAVASGAKDIRTIAVIAEYPTPVPPCGTCRQVIAEFGIDVEVVMANTKGEILVSNIGELLPLSFELSAAASRHGGEQE